VGLLEKIWAYTAVLISTVMGIYVTINAAKPLFNPSNVPPPTFPFCAGSYQDMVFTNVSYHANFTMHE
jgi:hypothetical protein